MLGAWVPAGGAAASAGGATAPAAASEAPAIRLRRVKSAIAEPFDCETQPFLSPMRRQRGCGAAPHTQVNNGLSVARAGRLEEWRPARDLGLPIVRECFRCALVLSGQRASEISDAPLHTCVIERLVERRAQLLHNLRRGTMRC